MPDHRGARVRTRLKRVCNRRSPVDTAVSGRRHTDVNWRPPRLILFRIWRCLLKSKQVEYSTALLVINGSDRASAISELFRRVLQKGIHALERLKWRCMCHE